MWARRMHGTEGEAVLCNAPFFVDEPALNYGDLVRVEQDDDGFWTVREVLRASGHRRLSVILGDPQVDGRELHDRLQNAFPDCRLIMEGADDPRSDAEPRRLMLLWVSVPPDGPLWEVEASVAEWLDEREADPELCGLDGPYETREGPFQVPSV